MTHSNARPVVVNSSDLGSYGRRGQRCDQSVDAEVGRVNLNRPMNAIGGLEETMVLAFGRKDGLRHLHLPNPSGGTPIWPQRSVNMELATMAMRTAEMRVAAQDRE